MFKTLFKKNNQTATLEVAVLDLPKIKNKYSSEIEEIHHEFDVASDKLLSEAKAIIVGIGEINVDKMTRLEKLGFKQSSEVTNLKPQIVKKELSEEQINLVQYYKQNYPLNKFITEEQVKEICHKYNLVCGDVSRYKGFVPEKNLKEIENFKLKKKEENCIITSNNFVFEDAEIRKAHYGANRYMHIYKRGTDLFSYQSSDGINFYGDLRDNPFNFEEALESFTIKNKILQICAPVKDMDISGLELIEGYKLEKPHIPDPVVLQPVKGGYLIITCWGDEASDPICVNEIMN